ncbi:MAG: nuclear transport factor 2 family protein [Candidatus Sulfotelmatobacter sp.]
MTKIAFSSRWFAVLLLFSAFAWWASVSIVGVAAMDKGKGAPAGDSTDVDAIKQLGLDMGDAMVAVDIDKLNQIYADDWATVTSSGKVITKEDLLHDFKSFHDKLESFELGPIDVQVYGDVAVANGTVKEKRNRDGKDTSGEFAYMDLLRKRGGKWVVVRSAGAKVESGN